VDVVHSIPADGPEAAATKGRTLMSIAILVVLGGIAAWGTVSTVLVARRDGYRQVPVQR
jgi:hypothetical protein